MRPRTPSPMLATGTKRPKRPTDAPRNSPTPTRSSSKRARGFYIALKGLAGRANMGATAGNTGFFDLRSADETRLSRTGEDLELVLELTALTEGVMVGVECCTAQLDGPAEYVAGRGVDGLNLLPRESIGLACGVDAGGEEHLVYVYVAEPGDDGLVEEHALYGGLASEYAGQILHRERLRKRFGAEA